MRGQCIRGRHHVGRELVVAIGQRRTPLRLPQRPELLPQRPVGLDRVSFERRVQTPEVLLQRRLRGRIGPVRRREVVRILREQRLDTSAQRFAQLLPVTGRSVVLDDERNRLLGIHAGRRPPPDRAQQLHDLEQIVPEHFLGPLLGPELVPVPVLRQVRGDLVRKLGARRREPDERPLLVLVQQPRLRRAARLERELGEEPQPEPVNGGDVRLLELERVLDPSHRQELRADALLEFRSRRLGERHRHDPLRRDQPLLDPFAELHLDAVGLARSRTGRNDA